MIILDTETTELQKPDIADLASQPHIIEVALIKLNDKWKEVDRYEALLNPQAPLNNKEHERITGLTEEALKGCPTFLELYEELVDFFVGERVLVAHNLEFDRANLVCELRRIQREFAFPYPPIQICTVERTKHLLGRRLKLVELYEMKMKRKFAQKHRAMPDCEALSEIVREMKIAA
jgi:DNA polymerase III epsilon subunit-like protein